MGAGAAPAPAAGTSVREGDEVDVEVSVVAPHIADSQWLKLVKTNHEVYVRVGDKVDITALPNECSLLVVANHQDLLIVGSNNGTRTHMNTAHADIRIHRLSEFHKVLEGAAAMDAAPESAPIQTIALPARPIWIR